jgi:hypothetical protein
MAEPPADGAGRTAPLPSPLGFLQGETAFLSEMGCRVPKTGQVRTGFFALGLWKQGPKPLLAKVPPVAQRCVTAAQLGACHAPAFGIRTSSRLAAALRLLPKDLQRCALGPGPVGHKGTPCRFLVFRRQSPAALRSADMGTSASKTSLVTGAPDRGKAGRHGSCRNLAQRGQRQWGRDRSCVLRPPPASSGPNRVRRNRTGLGLRSMPCQCSKTPAVAQRQRAAQHRQTDDL